MRSIRNIVKITTAIALSLSLVITILLPSGYLLLEYRYLDAVLKAEAETNAVFASKIISSNPEMWRFEQIRLEEFLSNGVKNNFAEVRRIVDIHNKVIARSPGRIETPVITRSYNLYDAGRVVARLEISRPLRPIMKNAMLVGIVGAVIGILIFLSLRAFPLSALSETLKELYEEKERAQDALAEVKKLSGLLPICASCKKIRDDSGYWNQLEIYISEHSEVEFSHGICPECVNKLYPAQPQKKGEEQPSPP